MRSAAIRSLGDARGGSGIRVAEPMRAVRLGRDPRAGARAGDSRPSPDLDVGPPGELEHRERVAPDVPRVTLPGTHVTPRSSASAEPHAYRSAIASSMPVSQSMSRDTRSATPMSVPCRSGPGAVLPCARDGLEPFPATVASREEEATLSDRSNTTLVPGGHMRRRAARLGGALATSVLVAATMTGAAGAQEPSGEVSPSSAGMSPT